MQTLNFKRMAAAGVASAALIATVACNGNGIETVRAENRDPRLLQTAANGSPLGTATAGNQQMLVNCGPYQRTLVRTTYLNGQPVASVDCVPAEHVAPAGYEAQPFAPMAAQPVVYQAAPAPRAVRTVATAPRTRTVAQTQRVVYTERKPVRSKTRSAVIIGTSAAAGAGVGALVGGKKGAIIGAVAGGGGAAVWDQVTRRQNR
ncbi:MAG TPA: hypothetical protein VMN81_02790 [Vicinamibacterales bacterium]|nr:hypothetical protein [Vicinamibacterales bacterium]